MRILTIVATLLSGSILTVLAGCGYYGYTIFPTNNIDGVSIMGWSVIFAGIVIKAVSMIHSGYGYNR
jgi:hypothetical protein